MQFTIDSWPWKFAILFALLGSRQFIKILDPREKNPSVSETVKWMVETLDSAAVAVGLVLFIIQPFILQAFYIPSSSMEDTLRISDRLLVSKLIYRLKDPQFQDVVVFKAPPAALEASNTDPTANQDYIKRCMGLPGDQVYVIDRKVYRNGKPVEEVYTKWVDAVEPGISPDSLFSNGGISYDMKIVDDAIYSRNRDITGNPEPWTQKNEPVPMDLQEVIDRAPYGRVPARRYLMLGDHRSSSNDSHVWGFVPRENIVGKAFCVFWPPTRLGLVDQMSTHPRKQ